MSIDEREYCDRLERVLETEYSPGRVRREPRLDSGREPDFLIDTWPIEIVIEVENRPEDVIAGAGQALLYSAETGAVPIVVYPPTGEDVTEMQLLGERIALAPVDPGTLPEA